MRHWYASLLRRLDRGDVTVAKAYRLLRAILNTAVADELIVRNPCTIKGGGVERTPERPVATVRAGLGTRRRGRAALPCAWC